MISEKRRRGLSMKTQLAKKVVEYAQQTCPECLVLITSLTTGYYPDADVLVTLYNVQDDKIMDVQRAMQRFCWDIQRKHAVIIVVRAFDPEQTKKYHKWELDDRTSDILNSTEGNSVVSKSKKQLGNGAALF